MSTPITARMVNDLRLLTGAGLLDCKKALVEADGNADEAVTILRKKGAASAAKKADRTTKEGLIESYIHIGAKVGVLIEVNCETDFVARNDGFKAFVRDLCLQIAATSPLYVSRDQVPEAEIAKERDIAAAQVQGKPPAAAQKVVDGKLEKYFSTVCLVDQSFVKVPEKTVKEILTEAIAKTGENIQIRRFVRFQLGSCGPAPGRSHEGNPAPGGRSGPTQPLPQLRGGHAFPRGHVVRGQQGMPEVRTPVRAGRGVFPRVDVAQLRRHDRVLPDPRLAPRIQGRHRDDRRRNPLRRRLHRVSACLLPVVAKLVAHAVLRALPDAPSGEQGCRPAGARRRERLTRGKHPS